MTVSCHHPASIQRFSHRLLISIMSTETFRDYQITVKRTCGFRCRWGVMLMLPMLITTRSLTNRSILPQPAVTLTDDRMKLKEMVIHVAVAVPMYQINQPGHVTESCLKIEIWRYCWKLVSRRILVHLEQLLKLHVLYRMLALQKFTTSLPVAWVTKM